MLSEMHLFPHRIPHPKKVGKALKPLAMPHHLSFEIDRNQTMETRITAELGTLLRNVACLILLNHPDIHFEAFIDFLENRLLPERLLPFTMTEIATWWVHTHTQTCFDVHAVFTDGELSIEGSTKPEQAGAVIDLAVSEDWDSKRVEYSNLEKAMLVRRNGRLWYRMILSENSSSGFCASLLNQDSLLERSALADSSPNWSSE
jgi:hypothetical protein